MTKFLLEDDQKNLQCRTLTIEHDRKNLQQRTIFTH